MPERIELCVRGGRDGRVPMTEPRDCDAGAEIEVDAALVVPDATSVAAHDRQVYARVGGKQRAVVGLL
jgi:hypothetical protein